MVKWVAMRGGGSLSVENKKTRWFSGVKEKTAGSLKGRNSGSA
jgi:hypothetical protein